MKVIFLSGNELLTAAEVGALPKVEAVRTGLSSQRKKRLAWGLCLPECTACSDSLSQTGEHLLVAGIPLGQVAVGS